MTDAAKQLLWFISVPFAIGAAFEFAPTWVAIPAVVILALFWIGACIQICEAHK